MAKNGAINKTTFTDQTAIQCSEQVKAKAVHITELRNAITKLETYVKNVDNCGYTNCCQSCQNACTCQSSKCQSCQNKCACQSCQNTCACQSCERREC